MSLSEWQDAYRQERERTRSGQHGYCKCRNPGYDRGSPKHCRYCRKPFKHFYLEAKRKGDHFMHVVTVRSVIGETVFFSGSEHLDRAHKSCFLGATDGTEPITIGSEYDLFWDFLTEPHFYTHHEEGDEFAWLENLGNNLDQ